MVERLICTPAYNRTYSTAEEAQASWQAGDDFKIISGPYFSIRDLQLIAQDYDEIHVVWGKTTSVRLYPTL